AGRGAGAVAQCAAHRGGSLGALGRLARARDGGVRRPLLERGGWVSLRCARRRSPGGHRRRRVPTQSDFRGRWTTVPGAERAAGLPVPSVVGGRGAAARPGRSGDRCAAPGARRARRARLVTAMADALRRHWPEYLMEAGLLGAFMISASLFASLLLFPGSPAYGTIPNAAV